MRKFGIGLGIVLLLVVVGAVLAPFFVDLNRYKPTLLSQVKPYIQNEVDFQSIELTILTGLGAEIGGLRIADDPVFSQEDFLKLESLQIRIRLLPLLQRKVQVKSILIREPVVRIVRDAKGAFNFEKILVSGAKDRNDKVGARETAGASPAGQKETGDPGILAGFLVSELEIQKGSIFYRDEKSGTDSEPLSIEQLDLKVEDVSLHGPIGIRVSAAWMEHGKQNLEMTGKVGPVGEQLEIAKVPFEIQASLQDVPIQAFLSQFPVMMPMGVAEGRLAVRATLEGSVQQGISSETEVNLSDLVLRAAGEEVRTTGRLEANLTNKMRVLYPSQQLLVESLTCSVNGNRALLEGSVEQFLKNPKWEFKAGTENLRPADLLALFPMVAKAVPEELRLEGPAVANIHSSGDLQDFKVEGSVVLDGMKVEYGETFRKASGIPLSLMWEGEKKGNNLTVKKLGMKLHQLDAGVSGDIFLEKPVRFGLLLQTNSISLQGWELILPGLSRYHLEGDLYARTSLRGTPENLSASLQATSDRVAFLLEGSGAAQKASEPVPGALEGVNLEVQAKSQSGDLTGTGDLNVKTGVVKSVRVEKILGRFQVQPKALEVVGLEFRVFEGGIRSTGRVDLTDKSWSFRPVVEEVAVGPLLDQLTKYKGLFSGKFSGELAAEGAPATEGGAATLAANGQFRLSQGVLENFNLVESVLDDLFGVEGVGQALTKKRGEVTKQERTRFDYLDCRFDLRDQIIQVNSQMHNLYTSKLTDSDALIDGKVGLGDQLLDLRGKIILSKKHSEEMASQSEAMKALLNPEQRMVLPISLKGSISKPAPFLDTQYVLNAMAKYYGQKGLEKLGEKLGLPKKQEGEKPADTLLKDLLKKK